MNTTYLRNFTLNFVYHHRYIKRCYEKYRDALITAHQRKCQLRFLENCLDNCIIPKTFLPRRFLNYSQKPFSDVAKEILIDSISCIKNEIHGLFFKVRQLNYDFRQRFNELRLNRDDYWNTIMQYCNFLKKQTIYNRTTQLNKKFDKIFRSSPWVKYSNSENVVNLSSVPLSFYQRIVLGYGLSFALPLNNDNILNFLTDFSKFEYFSNRSNNNSDNNVSCFKGFLLKSIIDELNNKTKFPKIFMSAINDLKRNPELIICKADKGGKAVILDKSAYVDKMNLLLNDQETYEELHRDPLKTRQRDFNKQLKNILKDHQELFNKFKSYLPSLPKIYGLPKIHKDNIPLRPIVSTINSNNYKLASWLSKLLSPCINKISNCNVNNTTEFISKVKDINLEGRRLVSFDVDSLFTNIPVKQCIEFLIRDFDSFNLDLPVNKHIFIKLLKLCCDESFFTFNNRFFKQRRGLFMGSPLSPILANIFMEFFERDFLPLVGNNTCNIWLRYVDDVFCILPNNLDIDLVISDLNSLHPSIKFKYEIEENSSLPFLDCLILKDNHNHLPLFKVYRKPTHSNSYIHSYSNHSYNIKLGTIANIFLRAYRICNNQFLDDEINYIYSTFYKLGYSKAFIDKGHFKSRRTYYGTNNRNNSNYSNPLILPPISDPTIPTIAKQLDITIVHKNSNTIRSNFSNKLKPNINNNAGIYSISCNDCNLKYIGESNDTTIRKKQHSYDIRTQNSNNALVKHILDESHSINSNNLTILKKVNDLQKRKLIESILIKNSKNLNVHETNYNLDPLSNQLVLRNIPMFRSMLSLIGQCPDNMIDDT